MAPLIGVIVLAEYRHGCVLLVKAHPCPRHVTLAAQQKKYLILGVFDAEALESIKYHAHDTRCFINQGQHFAPAMINLAFC